MPASAPSPVLDLQPVREAVRAPQAKPRELEYVRFKPLNRALHICMVISFITLALTGLSLKFSYTAWAVRLLGEVHELASAYGWREHDVLALSPWRRQAYLQMVRG